jgi:MerR family Zn(II)-responsive transcriptional regulator of zntA
MKKGRKEPSGKGLLRLSEAARAAGVSAQTVEYYILLGLIEPVREPGRRVRHFTAEHVRRIQLIRQLNASGYTLRAIRETYMRPRRD